MNEYGMVCCGACVNELDRLHKKGCGTRFLLALACSLVCSLSSIGSQYFQTSSGASTSCPLFTFFIYATVEAICTFGPDGWLNDLHTLLLMDDTVIFATSKSRLEEKLKLLKRSADTRYGHSPYKIKVYVHRFRRYHSYYPRLCNSISH